MIEELVNQSAIAEYSGMRNGLWEIPNNDFKIVHRAKKHRLSTEVSNHTKNKLQN